MNFDSFQSCSGDSKAESSDQRVIVNMSCLFTLLSVCRRPECGTLVERENIKVVRNGAMVRIHTLCNNSHMEKWDSSPSVGSGTGAIPVINILLSVYTLLTGLHVKQVCQQML